MELGYGKGNRRVDVCVVWERMEARVYAALQVVNAFFLLLKIPYIFFAFTIVFTSLFPSSISLTHLPTCLSARRCAKCKAHSFSLCSM